MVRRAYPELYRRVRKAVRAGRLVPEGGMWIEADTNVPPKQMRAFVERAKVAGKTVEETLSLRQPRR